MLVALFGWSAAPTAHPLSVSYSRFTVGENAVAAIVRLPLDDVDLLLRLDRDLDGTVADAEIERAHPALQRYLSERIQISAGGRPSTSLRTGPSTSLRTGPSTSLRTGPSTSLRTGPSTSLRAGGLAPSLQGTSTWKDQDGFPYLEARLSYSAPQRIDDLAVTVSVLTDLYTDHRNLSEIEFGGRREQFVFQHRNTYSGRREGAGSWQTARSFVRLGIEHIFTGYDHILFLFGLLLVGKGLKNLVAIVTSFTVAHSLTLSLATLGVVEPAAWTVEAAIALSIAYIGLENLFVKDVRHRWRITFAFGLIHGLGFANVLREMELPRSALAVSLFAFNLGVEIGQVAIVALMWPLLRYLERTPYRRPLVRVASAVIVAFGLFWFWQRIV